MIVLRQKRYGIVGDFRHSQALRLIKSADKDLERSDRLKADIDTRVLKDEQVRDRLLKEVNGKVLLEASDVRSFYNPALNKIVYKKDRVDSLAHEIGHYKNTQSTGKRKKVADINNSRNYRSERDKIAGYRKIIKSTNTLAPEVRAARVKFNKPLSIEEAIANYRHNQKINRITEREESNATKSGLRDLRAHKLDKAKYKQARKNLRDSHKTYKLTSRANRKYLLSEIVNPESYRSGNIIRVRS